MSSNADLENFMLGKYHDISNNNFIKSNDKLYFIPDRL